LVVILLRVGSSAVASADGASDGATFAYVACALIPMPTFTMGIMGMVWGRFTLINTNTAEEVNTPSESGDKSAIRNQVRIVASGSLLPSWEKARMRVSPRASAALRAGRPRSLPARASERGENVHV